MTYIDDDFGGEDVEPSVSDYDLGFRNTCFSRTPVKKNPHAYGTPRYNEFSRGELDGVMDYDSCDEPDDFAD